MRSFCHPAALGNQAVWILDCLGEVERTDSYDEAI